MPATDKLPKGDDRLPVDKVDPKKDGDDTVNGVSKHGADR